MTEQNTIDAGYPAKFTKEEDGSYSFAFRDIPDATMEADTLEEAKEMARFALTLAVEIHNEEGTQLPLPSQVADDEVLIQPYPYPEQ